MLYAETETDTDLFHQKAIEYIKHPMELCEGQLRLSKGSYVCLLLAEKAGS